MLTFQRGTRPRLTSIDTDLLAFIADYKQRHDGQAPTIREITDALGYRAYSAVKYRIDKLVSLGYLRKGTGARALSVVQSDVITAHETATPRGTLIIADKRLNPGKRYEVTIREVAE